MTGKERILAKLRGEPTDSLPLMPITMMFAAGLAGVRYRDYACDHRVLADAQIAVADRFGFDHVSAISDPAREASDLGAAIEWFDDQPPAIVESRALLASERKERGALPDELENARTAPVLRDFPSERKGRGALPDGSDNARTAPILRDFPSERKERGALPDGSDNARAAPVLRDFNHEPRLAHLRLPDPAAPGRMRDRVEAVRLLAERTGATRIVEGWVEGPCAMSADLRGLNTLMLDFFDDPPLVEALFDFTVRMEVEFARAQVEAGATLIGVGDAAASLVGPKLYTGYVLPWEQRLIAAIHSLGVPVRLHICGNTRRIAEAMGRTGAEIIDLDFLTPLAQARRAIGESQVLLGNIDPVRQLRDGTPESVEAALAECHRQAGAAYICGAGCEVPRDTPQANVEAMAQFARSRS